MIAARSADVRAPVTSVQEQSSTVHLSKTVLGCTAGEDAAARQPDRQIYCNAESFPNTTKWQLVRLKSRTTMEGPNSPSATRLFNI